jgi:hypothetical protein
MKALSTDVGLQLHWVQPSIFERLFELHSECCILGELRFDAVDSAQGILRVANSTTEHWTFRQRGVLKPRVTIREAEADDDLAVYWPKFWGDGRLEFTNEGIFHWKLTSISGTDWGFFNVQGELLFTLKFKLFDLVKIQSVVEIEAQWFDLVEMPLLLMLSWYLMVCNRYAGR